MGLLGDNDLATLQLAAGLLGGGSFGQAMQRGLGNYASAQETAMKRKMLEEEARSRQAERAMQVQKMQAEIAQRQQAEVEARRRQDILGRLLGGTNEQQTTGDAAIDAALKLGVSPAAIAFDLQNGGKKLGEWVNDRTKPDMRVVGNMLVDARKSPDGMSVPNVDSQGRATQTIADPNSPGGFRVIAPSGANDVYRSYLTAEQEVKDRFAFDEGYNPETGRMERRRRAPQQTGQQQPTPFAQSGYSGGDRNAAIAEQIRMIESELQRFPNDAPALNRELARLRAQSGGRSAAGWGDAIPMGPTAEEAAKQKAREQQEIDRAKDFGERRKTIMQSASDAQQMNASIGRIATLIGDFDGGKLSPLMTNIASGANSLGFKIDKNLTNKEAAQTIAGELALRMKNLGGSNMMPGGMSDGDRTFLTGLTPSLSQSRDGRKLLIDYYKTVNQRALDVATFARRYEAKHGAIDNGFFDQLQSWSNANPMFKADR